MAYSDSADLRDCLLCGRAMRRGDRLTDAPEIGIPVHRDCYERDAGIPKQRGDLAEDALL